MAVPVPTRALVWCGAVAGPVFTAGFLLAGSLRPGYDPMRHPISSLALTGAGWSQTANFLLTGLLLLAFAVGVRRILSGLGGAGIKPWAVGACGAGLVGAGLFPTDPVSGYPPGTPDELHYTGTGIAHDVFSMLFFLGIPVACAAFGRWFARGHRWGAAVYSLLTAAVFVAAFLIAGAGFGQTEGLVEVAGLYQRVSVATGLAWTTVLAGLLLHESGPSNRVRQENPAAGPQRSGP